MRTGSGRPGSGVHRRPGLWCVVFGLSMLAAGRAQEPSAPAEPGPAVADTAFIEPAVADTAMARRPGAPPRDTTAVEPGETLRVMVPDTLSVTVPSDSIPTTSGRGLNAPFWVMMRSVVVPGWGQATNRKWWKAVLVAGVEGYFISRIVHYERDRRRFEDKASEFPDEADLYEAKAEAAAEKRRDFSWWTGLAVAISAGDAFVDAHLRYFDVEFDARDAGEDEPVVNIEVGLRIDW